MAEPGFRVGDKVLHPAFGEGLVLAIKGAGDSLAYRISFGPEAVQRLLLARLAPLTPAPAAVKPAPAGRTAKGKA